MSQQDHKISSMVSLISSLAEESQQNHDMRGGFIPSLVNPVVAPVVEVASSSSPSRNNLIHVSDDEEEDSDSESDDESDSESDADSESSETESDAGSDSDDEKSESDVKTITILSEDLAKEDNNTIIFEENVHENDDEDNENDDEDNNSLFEMDELEPVSVVQETLVPTHEEVKTIHLDEPSVDEITDFSIFKTINISSLDESLNNNHADNNHSDNNNGDNTTNNSKVFETSDYKKMSITKLREIISKQGVSDASKLKKSDILKMLGVE